MFGENNKEINLEVVNEFYNMLMGEGLPEGMSMSGQPKLSAETAFSVIWYLQEHLGLIPDCFEKCSVCKGIYNSHQEGRYIDEDDGKQLVDLIGNNYCGSCWDHVECERCVD